MSSPDNNKTEGEIIVSIYNMLINVQQALASLNESLTQIKKMLDDHEQRIRMVEKIIHTQEGSKETIEASQYKMYRKWSIVITLVMVLFTAVNVIIKIV